MKPFKKNQTFKSFKIRKTSKSHKTFKSFKMPKISNVFSGKMPKALNTFTAKMPKALNVFTAFKMPKISKTFSSFKIPKAFNVFKADEYKNKKNSILFKGIALNVILMLAAVMAFEIFNSLAWVAIKTPTTTSILIDATSSTVIVERFNEETSEYEPVDINETGNAFEISIPSITFYEYRGEIVSTFGNDLKFRITLISDFRSNTFSNDPLVALAALYEYSSDTASIVGVQVIKNNFLILPPEESDNYQNSFPEEGFLDLFAEAIPAPGSSPLPSPVPTMGQDGLLSFSEQSYFTFPSQDFENVLGTIEIDETDRYKTTMYLSISPNLSAMDTYIRSQGFITVMPITHNVLTFNLAYRSVPFYTPN